MFNKRKKIIIAWFIFFGFFSFGTILVNVIAPFINENIIKNRYIKYQKNDLKLQNHNINNELENNLSKKLIDAVYPDGEKQISYTYDSSIFFNYNVVMDHSLYYKVTNNQKMLDIIKKRVKTIPTFSNIQLIELGHYAKFLLSFDLADITTINEYLQQFWDNDRKILNLTTSNARTEKEIYFYSANIIRDINEAYRTFGFNLGDYFDLTPMAYYLLNNTTFNYPLDQNPDQYSVRIEVIDGAEIIKFIDILPFNDAKEVFLSKKDQLLKWYQDVDNNYFLKLTKPIVFETQHKILMYHVLKKYFDIKESKYLEHILANWTTNLIKVGSFWIYYINLLRLHFGNDFVFKNEEFNTKVNDDYYKDVDLEIISYKDTKNSIQYLTQFYLMFKDHKNPKINLQLLKEAIDQTYNEIYLRVSSKIGIKEQYASEIYWYLIFYKNYDINIFNHKKEEILSILPELPTVHSLVTELNFFLVNPISVIDTFKAHSLLLNSDNKNAPVSYNHLYHINEQKQLIFKDYTEIHDAIEYLFFDNLSNEVKRSHINALNTKINKLIKNNPKIWTNHWSIYGIYLYLSEGFDNIPSDIKIDKDQIIKWIKLYLANYEHINIIGYFYSKQILNILEGYDKN